MRIPQEKGKKYQEQEKDLRFIGESSTYPSREIQQLVTSYWLSMVLRKIILYTLTHIF